MKNILNLIVNVVSGLINVNEVVLFRIMAKLFNTDTSKSTFVKETHAHKGFIEFFSNIKGKEKKIEIADLLFITYNKKVKELRICFLQAKYKKRNYRKFLSFQGNSFQWELLKDKPAIKDKYNLGFPPNILNFSNYESITSFGVFYLDKNGDIDFLYTIPRHFHPRTKKQYTTMNFFASCCCPKALCRKGMGEKETISTCSMDIFEEQVLKGKIGAPVDSKVMVFISKLVSKFQENNPDNKVVGELADVVNGLVNGISEFKNDAIECFHAKDVNYYPNTIIVITDGNYENEEKKD